MTELPVPVNVQGYEPGIEKSTPQRSQPNMCVHRSHVGRERIVLFRLSNMSKRTLIPKCSVRFDLLRPSIAWATTTESTRREFWIKTFVSPFILSQMARMTDALKGVMQGFNAAALCRMAIVSKFLKHVVQSMACIQVTDFDTMLILKSKEI